MKEFTFNGLLVHRLICVDIVVFVPVLVLVEYYLRVWVSLRDYEGAL